MQEILFNEITLEPASMIDGVGRVFWWNCHIYRAIKDEYKEFYRGLFEQRMIQDLFEKGLVSTEIAPLSLEGYGLVLRHKRIPFTSYSMEWCSEMLRDAALLTCDLSIGLHVKGLVLKDAHPWNILFNAGQPVFVDWGSICSFEQQHEWPYIEFRDRFIFPLYLMSAGLSRIARMFMFDTVTRPSSGDVFRLLLGRIPLAVWLRYLQDDRKHMRMRFEANTSFFESLRLTVQAIPITEEVTEWTQYEGPDNRFSHQPIEKWPMKLRNVHRFLQDLQPESVLDIGCNRGWFSELAARTGSRVIASDIDEPSIAALYKHVRANGLPILPLVMDICSPTPPHGLTHAYPAAQERFRADMVLSLAVTHHLVFKRGLTFEAIAKQLAAFTRKWLIVEFVPSEDRYVSEWMNEQFSWYNLDNFVRSLDVFFSRINILDSSPAPRLLLFCEK